MTKTSKWLFIIAIVLIGAVGMGWFGYLYWNGYFEEPTNGIPREAPKNHSDEPGDNMYDEIRVFEPNPSQAIKSPLSIRGEAKGTWFFEATFPVSLVDGEGNIIATGFVTAQDEWMTEEFVTFAGTLEFEKPKVHSGVLILRNDNPSGLPQYDKEYQVPINFSNGNGLTKITNFEECVRAGYPIMESYPRQCRTSDGETFVEEIDEEASECRPTGCSGQVCADEDIITTCEYLPEYACYENAVCERQPDGECGWTMTDELINCLAQYEEE